LGSDVKVIDFSRTKILLLAIQFIMTADLCFHGSKQFSGREGFRRVLLKYFTVAWYMQCRLLDTIIYNYPFLYKFKPDIATNGLKPENNIS
jgi:hypothetical protein